MSTPRSDELTAGPETDRFIHARVFKRHEHPAPPYTTAENTSRWLAKQYALSTIPIEGSLSTPTSEPTGYVAVRHVEPGSGDDVAHLGLEPLAQGDTVPLAIARSVLIIEGLAQKVYRVTPG